MPPRRIRNARKEDEAEEDSQAEEESEESEKQPDVATNSQPGTDNQDVAKEEPEEQDESLLEAMVRLQRQVQLLQKKDARRARSISRFGEIELSRLDKLQESVIQALEGSEDFSSALEEVSLSFKAQETAITVADMLRRAEAYQIAFDVASQFPSRTTEHIAEIVARRLPPKRERPPGKAKPGWKKSSKTSGSFSRSSSEEKPLKCSKCGKFHRSKECPFQ
ncbi:hypothetical protein ADUPG1_009931 [Aduncisulcus paluster]|uniref:Uncharacterized protein n=1 Tax=Aduncisulcus paluster TaxID=2918883 RepID=A0ABQ5L164_9EUKA|nr:hypothetical protein ADUPG1_009931 [Aduncisulcus paluster]